MQALITWQAKTDMSLLDFSQGYRRICRTRATKYQMKMLEKKLQFNNGKNNNILVIWLIFHKFGLASEKKSNTRFYLLTYG